MPDVKFLFSLKDKVTAGLSNINKSLDTMEGKLIKAKKELDQVAKRTEKLRGLGKSLTVGVTLPVIGMGVAMVKAAGEMQSMQQQLSTMLGSELAGAKMFNEIKEMAAKTPFGTKDLMAATNTMLGFGISQEKAIPLMKQLGDISGGNAARFQSLALAFSQVSSAGKLQGQDLNQMINAGFNPLESIAKRTGKSVGYWKEQMSKGKVTVQMVEQAMKDATSEGGRFYKMMEKQSQTFEGQFSTFQDELYNSLAEFGKIILPDVIKGLQQLSKTLEWINSLSPSMKRFVVILMGISSAIGPLLFVVGSLPMVLKALKEGVMLLAGAIKFLSKALWALVKNPWVLVLTLAIVAIIAVIKNWGKIVEWLKTVWQNVGNFITGIIQNISNWLDDLLKKLGWVAYLIPGLSQLKVSKDVANSIKGRQTTNNSSVMTNSNNTTTTNNYTTNNYGSIMPMTSAAVYAR